MTKLTLFTITDGTKFGKFFFPKDGTPHLPEYGPTWVKMDRPTMIQWYAKRKTAEEVMSKMNTSHRKTMQVEGYIFEVE